MGLEMLYLESGAKVDWDNENPTIVVSGAATSWLNVTLAVIPLGISLCIATSI
jgi:hypothetical protein